MPNLAEQIVDIIGQSSKLLGIMYFIVNIKKNKMERPPIVQEQFVY